MAAPHPSQFVNLASFPRGEGVGHRATATSKTHPLYRKEEKVTAKTTDRTELFETMPIPKAVLTLSVPTILSSLVMLIYNLADTYFVGLLNDSIQTAAVTLASPMLLSLNAVNNLFGVGSSSMMSRALGQKDSDTARRVSAFGVYCALACGLLYSLLVGVFMTPLLGILGASAETMQVTRAYMTWTICYGAAPAILNVVLAYMVRSEGSSLHASIGTMSGCILNIILDPIFILPWGLDLGAAGAGLATCLSNCVACCYFFILIFLKRKSTIVCLNPKMFRFRKRIVTGVCGVGVPAAIQNLLNVTGMTILNNFTAAYGAQAVAAMGIAQKVSHVPMQIALGMSQGVMPLYGYNYSSGNIKRLKGALAFTLKIGLTVLTLAAVLCFVFAAPLIEVFMKDATVVEYGTRLIRAFCIANPFQMLDFVCVGIYQSCGLGKYALVFAVLRKIVLEIPLLFLLNRIYPLFGLPFAQVISEMILAAAGMVVLKRLFNRLEKENRGMEA